MRLLFLCVNTTRAFVLLAVRSHRISGQLTIIQAGFAAGDSDTLGEVEEFVIAQAQKGNPFTDWIEWWFSSSSFFLHHSFLFVTQSETGFL